MYSNATKIKLRALSKIQSWDWPISVEKLLVGHLAHLLSLEIMHCSKCFARCLDEGFLVWLWIKRNCSVIVLNCLIILTYLIQAWGSRVSRLEELGISFQALCKPWNSLLIALNALENRSKMIEVLCLPLMSILYIHFDQSLQHFDGLIISLRLHQVKSFHVESLFFLLLYLGYLCKEVITDVNCLLIWLAAQQFLAEHAFIHGLIHSRASSFRVSLRLDNIRVPHVSLLDVLNRAHRIIDRYLNWSHSLSFEYLNFRTFFSWVHGLLCGWE